MWQKPAQPSASYIPASNRGSGFCSLYRYPLFAFLLSSCILSSTSRSLRLASFFPFSSCCSLLSPPAPSFFDHRRCCQTTTCTPGPGQLPSCGHPFPFIPPPLCLSLSLGLSRPLRRESLPFAPRSLYPLPLSISRCFFPFSSFPSTPSGSSACPSLLPRQWCSHIALLLFPRLYRSNPILQHLR